VIALTALLLSLLALPLAAQTIERQETSLNGTWEYVKVTDLDAPVPTEGWQAKEVPGQLPGYNYERAWSRRTFACDASAGRRVKLHFGGVNWNSRVLVNGKPVGGNFGGV